MDTTLQHTFSQLWTKYFPGAELPITFYYAPEPGTAEPVPATTEWRCLIGQLGAVRKGESLCFDAGAICCGGGQRYTGFTQELRPGFEHFLSCGIPGKLEGERYKKSPEIVLEMIGHSPEFVAPAPCIVFKRWDKLEAGDEPAVAIFFAPPDVLSGLFTLSGFAESDIHLVIAPFCAGCGSIIQFPYLERDRERPRGVIGMFDVSARPYVARNTLTFAVPMNKFTHMIEDMDESFLTTGSWAKVQGRMKAEE